MWSCCKPLVKAFNLCIFLSCHQSFLFFLKVSCLFEVLNLIICSSSSDNFSKSFGPRTCYHCVWVYIHRCFMYIYICISLCMCVCDRSDNNRAVAKALGMKFLLFLRKTNIYLHQINDEPSQHHSMETWLRYPQAMRMTGKSNFSQLYQSLE